MESEKSSHRKQILNLALKDSNSSNEGNVTGIRTNLCVFFESIY